MHGHPPIWHHMSLHLKIGAPESYWLVFIIPIKIYFIGVYRNTHVSMIANLTPTRLLTHKCTYIYIVNLMCVWILTCVHAFSFFVNIEFRQVFVYLNYASCTEFYWEMPGLKPMDLGHCVFPNVDSILWSLMCWLFFTNVKNTSFGCSSVHIVHHSLGDRSCRASPVNTKTQSQSIIFLGEKVRPDMTGVLGATETPAVSQKSSLFSFYHHQIPSIAGDISWYIILIN